MPLAVEVTGPAVQTGIKGVEGQIVYRRGLAGVLADVAFGEVAGRVHKNPSLMVGINRSMGQGAFSQRAIASSLGALGADLIRARTAAGRGAAGYGTGRYAAGGTRQSFKPYSSNPLWVPVTKTAKEEPSPLARRVWAERLQGFDMSERRGSTLSTGKRGGPWWYERRGRGDYVFTKGRKRRWASFEGGYRQMKSGGRVDLSFSGQMMRDLRVKATFVPGRAEASAPEMRVRLGLRSTPREGRVMFDIGTFEFRIGFATQRSLRIAIVQHYGLQQRRYVWSSGKIHRMPNAGLPPRPFAFFDRQDESALQDRVRDLMRSANSGTRSYAGAGVSTRLSDTGRYYFFKGHRNF